MYYSYLPTKTPEKSGRRLDQSNTDNIEKSISIMINHFNTLKEEAGKFYYNNTKVGSLVILGKLKRCIPTTTQLGKPASLIQI
jgi:hypothetical protein